MYIMGYPQNQIHMYILKINLNMVMIYYFTHSQMSESAKDVLSHVGQHYSIIIFMVGPLLVRRLVVGEQARKSSEDAEAV